MKTIVISGAIGWDVSPSDIRRQLAEAKGEAIDVEISSPGGFVTDGLEIYNMIRNYPGQKATHITGLAASMASYIALAGDKVTAEGNTVFMIHNALGGAIGDHRELRKAADVFEGFSSLLARAYSEKSGKPIEEIRALMDAESWYFGHEAKEAGFVDEVIGEPTTDRAAALVEAKALRSACDETVRKFEADVDAPHRVAAMLPVHKVESAVVDGSAAAEAAISQQEGPMDQELLKAEYDKGVQAGIEKERVRVARLHEFRGLSAKADQVIEEAVASGAAYDDIAPKLTAAAAQGRAPAGDNPPVVQTALQDTASGVDPLTADDMEAMRIFGLSEETYRKHKGGK